MKRKLYCSLKSVSKYTLGSFSADEVLAQLILHLKVGFAQPLHRYEPPENVAIAKDVRQLVKVRLLLITDEILVLELRGELELDAEVVFPLL